MGCWRGYLSGERCRFAYGQLIPLSLTVSCSSKSRMVLLFWYHLTQVVPDKGPLNRCCCSLLVSHIVHHAALASSPYLNLSATLLHILTSPSSVLKPPRVPLYPSPLLLLAYTQLFCLYSSSIHLSFQWLYEKIAVIRVLEGKSWTKLKSMLEGEHMFMIYSHCCVP